MDRAVSPVVGVALLAFVTVVLSLTVVAAAPALTADPPPAARLTLSADASTDRITIEHVAGDRLDVTELNLTVEIDGTRLEHQPPIPFFATRGFVSGPTGPFNTASPDRWRVGEAASFRIATTNRPGIDDGATVSVTVATDSSIVSRLTTRAT